MKSKHYNQQNNRIKNSIVHSTLHALKTSVDPSGLLSKLANQEYLLDSMARDEIVKLLNQAYSATKFVDQGLITFCEFINSSYSVRDVILQYQFQNGSHIINAIAQELQRGSQRPSVLLKTLGTFCYSACFNSYKAEKICLNAVLSYCSLTYDEQICRLAINCIANMLSKSDYAAIPAKLILLNFTHLLSSYKKLESVHTFKLYCNVMRAMQLALPHFAAEEPNKVLSLFLALKKILFIGALNDSDKSQKEIYSPISTEGSDSEINSNSDEFYYSKIKCSTLFCIQILFKRYSQLLFSFWSQLFPSLEAPLETILSKPSLISLWAQEKSSKVRISIAATISIIIDNSPLSKISSERNGDFPVSNLSQSISLIIVNLYSSISYFLVSENTSQLECALLKTLCSLMNHSNYEKLERGLTQGVIKALFTKLKSDEINVKSVLLASLATLFKDPNEEVKLILTPNFIQGMFYRDDLHTERLQVLSKIARSYPESLKSLTIWLKAILSKFIYSEDPRTQSCAFEVIEELFKSEKSTPIVDFVIDITFRLIQNNDMDRVAQCFNSLSLLSEFPFFASQQFSQLFLFINKMQHDPSPLISTRCGALKLIGSLSRTGCLPSAYFSYAIRFILSQNLLSNQNVVISSSFALSFLCLNRQSLGSLEDIISALDENSKNKKEKIVSSAIISIGNLFETFSFCELNTHFQQLLDLTLNGLYHKNSKVGWDSCNSLVKFYDNHTENFFQLSGKLLPILMDTILNHHNYRTRINTCQLIRKYTTELYQYDAEFIDGIIQSLDTDKDLVITDATVLRYQRYFRQELVFTLMFLVRNQQNLSSDFAESLSNNLYSIYEWLNKFLEDLQEEDQEIINIDNAIKKINKSLAKLLIWIEETDQIRVSFGLSEDIKELQRAYRACVNLQVNA